MKANFEQIIQDTRPVVIDFHAEWCGPCKVQSPILKDLAAELGDKIRIIKIDVDQNPALAGRYQIQSVPTLMVFRDGKIQYKQAGVHSKPQIMNILNNNL